MSNSNYKYSRYSQELIGINYSFTSGGFLCVMTAKSETEGTQWSKN